MAFRCVHFLLGLCFVCHLSMAEGRNVSSLTSMLARQLKSYGDPVLLDLYGKADDNSIPSGFCKTWMGTVVTENATWEEAHCRRCRCDVQLGAVCADANCTIAFHPYLDSNCEQWSSDGCCCLRSTCVHEGVHYAAEEWFLLTPSDPCTLCKCDPSDGLPRCLETTCPKLQCVDATSVPGECCPLCLSGHNCRIPPLPVPVQPDAVNTAVPILVSASRLLTFTVGDSSLVWNCTCAEPGGDASCVQLASNVTLTNVDIKNATMTNTAMNNVTMTNVDIENVTLTNTAVNNVTMTNVNIKNVTQTKNVTMTNVDIKNTTLTNVDKKNATIANMDKKNVSLTNVHNTNTTLTNVDDRN